MNDSQLRQLHSLCTLTGIAAFLLVVALGIPISVFADDFGILQVLAVIGTTLVVEGATIVPLGILRRSLDFRSTALADGARSIVDLCVTLLLAALGARYWSLVIGSCSGVLISALLIRNRRRVNFEKPTRTQLLPTLLFTRPILFRNIASFLAFSGDTAIGKFSMSKAALGHYSLAFTIAYAPGDKITQVILRVVPAVLGNVRESTVELRRYFLAVTTVIALITMPMFAGIAFLAPDLIPLLLGEQWAPMIPIILPLCIYGVITESLAMVGHVLQALGRAQVLLRNGIFALVLMPVSFFVLSHFGGGVGLASAWAVGAVLLGIRPLLEASKRLQLPLLEYFRSLAIPALGVGAMLVALSLLKNTDHLQSLRPLSRIVINIFIGATTYAVIVWFAGRGTILALWKLAKTVLASRRAQAKDVGAQ